MMKSARIMRMRPVALAAYLMALLSLDFLPVAEAQLGKPEGLYYKSWAIVIGVEQYVLAPSIPGAIKDAKKVAEAFRQLGFDEVVELYDKDASARRLQQLLNDMLPRKVGRMDRLVLVYVGHAGIMQDPDGQDRGYLVPFDAPVNSAVKSITVEQLKEFTRRSASKHTFLILDAPVFGWETTEPSGLSLEGRMAPELDTERRAVQVVSAASKGEAVRRSDQGSRFIEALLAGLSGAADLDGNGWLMASELGSYLVRQVETTSGGLQHPSSLRIDGDGDMVLIEGKTSRGATVK
ncbi:MAG: caspase family protein [Nitrospira sp.]|nr:caspase family protein [Nitrospira sp.]MBS0167609.1 caspase family protein [Nitrospira sp.]